MDNCLRSGLEIIMGSKQFSGFYHHLKATKNAPFIGIIWDMMDILAALLGSNLGLLFSQHYFKGGLEFIQVVPVVILKSLKQVLAQNNDLESFLFVQDYKKWNDICR